MDLSLKYRPTKFSEVIGQYYIVESIKGSLKYNELPSLYLFSGERGTGKTTIARLISMDLCCQNKNDDGPCNECDACKSIIKGNYFSDINEINAAQFTKKDDANNLIFDTINYQPLISSKKIYILDECHQLSKAAQQSLLKIFEEPPSNVVFILCTTEPNKVLSTIIDRSIHYEFKPIAIKDIFNRIKFICENENINITDEAIWAISKESNGSMRKPFKILNTIGIHNNITIDMVENIIGTTNIQASIEFLKLLIEADRPNMIKFVEDVISNGKNIENVFIGAMECLIDILHIKTYKENCIINKSDHSIAQLQEISKKITKGDTILNVLNSLDNGIKKLNNSYASQNILSVMISLDVIKEFLKK